ncbi:MAG: hypothetical protein JW741_22630 [Sedimentisphaerales bacterium]|nr:hypothetical protein [Sedimentisphaerales bacterium]
MAKKEIEIVKDPSLPSAAANAGFRCSHALRLSAREWVVVLVVLVALMSLAPAVWDRLEGFEADDDYRMPYKMGNDYWHYRRYCRRACAREKTPVIGDSVVWGHYVAPDQTLSHYLNELSGGARFANLGLDGTHPAALDGLLRHYAEGISGRPVLLQFNPLWMTSEKHDLQTTKEFHFNHPALVPQFRPRIPCYRASLSTRLWAVTERYVPFFSWTSHLRYAYWDNMGLHAWTLEHPGANPLAPLRAGLPAPSPAGEPAPQRADAPVRKQDPAWVEADNSLQWRLFRRSILSLRRRHCDVFVLVGPFNEHTLGEPGRAGYAGIKTEIVAWLQAHDVPHLAPPPLPAPLYVDTSHPVAQGYALLAEQLWDDAAFQSWLDAK